ncbi:salicylate/benzoate carboxyl methyltransferase-like [Hibiscus syriacus]|uniref:salicylate/benzoate carboxyl methyltransferase-like n=1 Tax=Hibiscus syriacus TaxID=106335 RepID=UPI0019203D9B|nr:salicylate/benzoate carboxyl methyltransferase-like [Hibiscus syriacus]
MDTITSICQQQHWESPELHALLNDLTHNDFNTVFRSVPALSARLKEDIMGRCFIARVAGSFYGRLFPSKTIHFVHSSYSLHWLSKVPEGVEYNKGNIYIAKSSLPNVSKA